MEHSLMIGNKLITNKKKEVNTKDLCDFIEYFSIKLNRHFKISYLGNSMWAVYYRKNIFNKWWNIGNSSLCDGAGDYYYNYTYDSYEDCIKAIRDYTYDLAH